MIRQSIGKEKALELAAAHWWVGKPHREIAKFQLFTTELCMPFDIFHEAIEKSLGRPVWTHELGLNYEAICKEFLGEQPAPSMDEIIGLIPKDKQIVVVTP